MASSSVREREEKTKTPSGDMRTDADSRNDRRADALKSQEDVVDGEVTISESSAPDFSLETL